MKKRLGTLLLLAGIAAAPLYFRPTPLIAQQDEVQRAYDTGYQNGVNDARRNRPMNMKTDDWHGDRLTSYQRGYEEGYRTIAGRSEGRRYSDPEAQRAYETGFRNGEHARESSRPMNLKTDDWHGDRLEAYRQGYEDGYSGRRDHDDHDRDRDDR